MSNMQDVFREVVEIAPFPALLHNEIGVIVYANKAFERVFGYSREEVLQRIFVELVHPRDREKAENAMRRRLAGETVEPFLIKVRGKDGNYRTVQVFVSRARFMGEILGIIALSDVTKLEEQKVMLTLITRALRHDVLNALTTAMSYFEISREICKNCENSNYLEKLGLSIERAVKIIKDLREFEEAVVKGELERINVREIVEDVADHFNVPITIEGECEVVADRGLRAVFENLFQNAIQHGKTDRIEVTMKNVGDFCEIRVIDYGKGIPEEIKDNIFEEGFTYGEAASTGQGLYLVKKLVERYGGEIRVEDNSPRGAVFVVRLRAWVGE